MIPRTFCVALAAFLVEATAQHLPLLIRPLPRPEPVPDYRFQLPPGQASAEFRFAAKTSAMVRLLVEGLSLGGCVKVNVNGQSPAAFELLATQGLAQGRADQVVVRAAVEPGENVLSVSESEGAQMVRIPQTERWFAASSDTPGAPVFSVDFALMQGFLNQYPVVVYYGPDASPFFRFTGFCDKYYGETYVSDITDVTGTSAADMAGLSYVLHHPPRGLLMPTRIRLIRDSLPGSFSLRIWQRLQAVDTPVLDANLEFLHVVTPNAGGLDWMDGVPDWVWHRTLTEDNPDAFPGSHTALCRIDDNSARVFPYVASTSDPGKRLLSAIHHTGQAMSMESTNAIGGWFTRSGTGCVGFVFHQYRASFRADLRPVMGHCGDGADTHFFLFWGELFGPLNMKRGDEVEMKYSLFFLPSEPLFTDIIDLNEADILFFGTDPGQKSPVAGWVGTKDAIGIHREDGSLLLRGLGSGSKAARFPLPEGTRRRVRRVCRFVDMAQPEVTEMGMVDGTVEVIPGAFTLVDCGAVLRAPR